MLKISLLITEDIEDVGLLQKQLSGMNTDNFSVQCMIVQQHKLSSEEVEGLQKQKNIIVNVFEYTADDDLLFKDIVEQLSGEFFIPFVLNANYPADFLTRIFHKAEDEKHVVTAKRAPYKERLLKAVQQSKYGMGILKKDIQREFPDLEWSVAYKLSDFQKLHFLQLPVDDSFAVRLGQLVRKKNLEYKKYVPDYTAIEYFTEYNAYKEAVKNEAGSWAFRFKPNTTGFPFYMFSFIIFSAIVAPFAIKAVFPLLIISSLYLLAITLEALAISTIKRQNDLLLGMLLFFPSLHFLYLWYSIKQKFR